MTEQKDETIKMYYPESTKEILTQAVEQNLPVLMVGETGTGKTSFIREIAKQQGRNLTRVNLTGQTGVDDFIGKYLANESGTYWIDGSLTACMKNGDWIVLDEINMALPEILAKMHSLLDDDRKITINEKDGEIVKPHPNFRIFATMNPSDEYAGTKELNRAFLSRFPVIIDVDYSDNEQMILVERTGIEEKIAGQLVELAKEVRSQKMNGKLSTIISTRDLIYCSMLIKMGNKKDNAIRYSILNKFPKDEQGALTQLISIITGGEIKIGRKTIRINGYEDLIKMNEEQTKKIASLQRANRERNAEYERRLTERDKLITELRNPPAKAK